MQICKLYSQKELNIYRMTACFLIIFLVLNILTPLRAAADDETDAAASEKTRIISIIPYVDITENGITQSIPVSSREDTRANPNITFLMIKLVINNQDAQKYYGKPLYIFKLKTHQEIADLSEQLPSVSFIVQEDKFFEYNVKILTDLSNLNNGEIYNKFIIAVKTDTDEYISISEARYVDNINSLSNKKDAPPASISKKGLAVQMMGEARLLGVEHTTVKLYLNEFMSSEETSNTEIYFYEGESFYFNINKIAEYDKLIRNFTNDGIKVTAVLLLGAEKDLRESRVNLDQSVGDSDNDEDSEDIDDAANTSNNLNISSMSPSHYLIHPNALENPVTDPNAPTYFYGINMLTESGVKYFSALMSFIADRYVKEDTGYGRVYNIILGDEIGRSASANNCGQIALEEYIRDYLRALRICDTAVRSRFGGSRVYIPLDNRFASRPAGESGYNNKDIIDLLCEYSETEGNFLWNIAFNAYNSDPASPEIWKETEPLNNYDTSVITLKNIDILCDYINLEKKEYLPDGENRKIMLAEQGYSSGENNISTDEKMNEQAAAFVYAYLKIRDLPDITAFIYYRHVDADSDFYSYGLWTKSADNGEPRRKKKIYDVFKYMDTNKEAEQIEFAKSIIGVESFSEISPEYSKDREAAINIYEVTALTLKSKPSNATISRFNTADLKGFIGTSNVSFLNIVKYSGESEMFGGNQNSLLIGFNRTSQGNYGGIFKSYASSESLDLSDRRYIGINVRIDTAIENIETIPLLIILEGESINTSNGKNTKNTQPTNNNSTVITSGVVQADTASEIEEDVKSIGIFEGAANITPNEDTKIYFDLKDFKESGKINKVKLLINPYYAGMQSYDANSITIADIDYAYENGDEKISESSEIAKYDFNLYVFSIVSAVPSSSVSKTILNIFIGLVIFAVVGYVVLIVRAKIITHRRRKKRAEQRRRRQRQQRQQPPR